MRSSIGVLNSPRWGRKRGRLQEGGRCPCKASPSPHHHAARYASWQCLVRFIELTRCRNCTRSPCADPRVVREGLAQGCAVQAQPALPLGVAPQASVRSGGGPAVHAHKYPQDHPQRYQGGECVPHQRLGGEGRRFWCGLLLEFIPRLWHCTCTVYCVPLVGADLFCGRRSCVLFYVSMLVAMPTNIKDLLVSFLDILHHLVYQLRTDLAPLTSKRRSGEAEADRTNGPA